MILISQASLRETAQVKNTGIQSVWNRANKFGPRHRKSFKRLLLKIVGMDDWICNNCSVIVTNLKRLVFSKNK